MTTPNLEWFLDEVLGVKLTPGQLTLVMTRRGTKDLFADIVRDNKKLVPPRTAFGFHKRVVFTTSRGLRERR